MATVQEIERAIERLPETERNALESRLLARRCGLSSLNDEEQAELLRSLDEAEREIDEGRRYNTEEMRPAFRGMLGQESFSLPAGPIFQKTSRTSPAII